MPLIEKLPHQQRHAQFSGYRTRLNEYLPTSMFVRNQRIDRFIRPYASTIIFSGFLLVCESLITLSIPLLIQDAIETGVLVDQFEAIGPILILVFSAFVVKYSFTIGHTFLLGTAATKFVRKLRSELYMKLVHAKYSFLADLQVGDLTSRLIHDVSILHRIIATDLPKMTSACIMFTGGIIFLIITDWGMALWVTPAIPVGIILIRIFSRNLRQAVKKVQRRVGDTSALLSEYLYGVDTIKSLGCEAASILEINTYLDTIFEAAMKRVHIAMVFRPAIGFLWFALFGVIAWACSVGLRSGYLGAVSIASFLMYSGIVGAATVQIANLYSSYQEALGAAERVFILLRAPKETDTIAAAPLKIEKPVEISFMNVSFYYHKDSTVLTQASFKVPAGKLAILSGPNGAGKSTIIRLILKLYEPAQGQIIIAGNDIKNINCQDLRKHIGVMPQNPILFRGTIRSNLLMGLKNRSQRIINEAADEMSMAKFIRELPEGYETPVGERGVTLSAGQLQKLAFMRLILMDPPILIIDEPISDLDEPSRNRIGEIISTRFLGRTIIIVSHKSEYFRHADTIIEVGQGGFCNQNSF